MVRHDQTSRSREGGVQPPPGRPRRRFGQHFLEAAWVTKLVDALAAAPDETFVEIGPGRGALTAALAPHVQRLVCVEIDRDLAAALAASAPPNVTVITGDILRTDLAAIVDRDATPVRVVGNLPYNISSPILFTLLAAADGGRRLRDATLMLQKEVAERVTARPGDRAYGALAIQVARLADAETLFTLPPGAFRPPPKVTSAVVRLRFRPSAVDADGETFERVVRGIFLQRRKTLLNALTPVAASMGASAPEAIERAGLDPRKRPEELTLPELGRLTMALQQAHTRT